MTYKFPTLYQEYIYKSRYARYNWDLKRREEWPETVSRYISFFKQRIKNNKIPWKSLEKAILNLEVMPSMRALMTAGPALDKDNVAGYNCAYVAVDEPKVFDEILYILMCGTGVGFSVERTYINKLPIIAEEFRNENTCIEVRDSKIGWASAYRQLISLLYNGTIPRWDLSKLRPKGSPLKTFGGRSSGPEPLEALLQFTVSTFRRAAGRKLNSLEVHDLICKIAEVVVCGGVRRSALLSLSNLTEERMKTAKSGAWYNEEPQRALANNSVAYTETPDIGIFMSEWLNLYMSKSGERGIFNRQAAIKNKPERREAHEFGTNPCGEIVLRSKQFCNLTEVVMKSTDSERDIKRKIKIATILGTIQSTLSDFRYLSKTWKDNTEEERLLGVSLTGIMDYPGSNKFLQQCKQIAIDTNKKYSKLLKIQPSTAITCIKPSGTVSQLVNSSSGIHPRFSEYYIRRVRADRTDPLCLDLMKANIPCEVSYNNPNEYVFSFPIKSPSNSLTIKDISAIEQLNFWKTITELYCEHNCSISVYVKDWEWLDVASWVYKNWKVMVGVTFFPHTDNIYKQAPYESISKEEYNKLITNFPTSIKWSTNEYEDNTTASKELACVGGSCEL